MRLKTGVRTGFALSRLRCFLGIIVMTLQSLNPSYYLIVLVFLDHVEHRPLQAIEVFPKGE
jgi:hypothetical protein